MRTPANPYAGLRPLRDGERIYGRRREITDLTNLLLAERIVVLHGPSGAGKTSVLQAGVVPIMRHRGFTVRPIIRLNDDPPAGWDHHRFAASLLGSLGIAVRPEAMQLQDYLDPSPNGELLLFDQFEDVLTTDPVNAKARMEFFRQLGEALNAPGRWALFAMRDDFVASLDPYLRYIPSRLSSTLRLDRLKGDDACEAIRRPAEDAGVRFADACVQQIYDDLRAVNVPKIGGGTERAPGELVEPILLQVVCQDLWEDLKEGTREIAKLPKTMSGKSIGAEALEDYYDRAVRDAAKTAAIEEREIRRWCGDRLVTSIGTRGQVVKGEGLPLKAVEALLDSDLLREQMRNGAECVELMHDRLIQPVVDSNARWMDSLSQFQREAELWAKDKRSDRLLSGEALEAAEAQADTMVLVSPDREFLRESQKAAWRDRAIRWGAVALLVMLIGMAGMMAWVARSRAQVQAALAESDLWQVRAMLDNEQPAQALAFLARALRGAHDSALGHMWAAALLSRGAPILPIAEVNHGSPLTRMVFSPDGKRLLTASEKETRIWDTLTGAAVGKPLPGTSNAGLNMNGALAALYDAETRTGAVYEVASGKKLYETKEIFQMIFSKDPQKVFVFRIAGPGQQQVELLDVRTKKETLGPFLRIGGTVHLALQRDRLLLPRGAPFTNGLVLWEPFQPLAPEYKLSLPATVRDRVRVAPGGRFAAVVFPPDGDRAEDVVEVWDFEDSRPLGSRQHLADPKARQVFGGFGPQAQDAIAWGDRWLEHWNALDGTQTSPRWQLAGHIDYRSSAPVLVEELKEWSAVRAVSDCRLLAQLLARGAAGMRASADAGNFVATAGAGGTKVEIWKIPNAAAEGAKPKMIEGGPMLRAADGTTLVLNNSEPPEIRTAKGESITVRTAPAAEMSVGATFRGVLGQGGEYAAIADSDERLLLFHIPSKRNIAQLYGADEKGQGFQVTAMVFTPDEKTLITAHENATLQFWEAGTGLPIGDAVVLPFPAIRMATTPGGERVLVETRAGVSEWDVTLGTKEEAEALARLAEAAGGMRLPPDTLTPELLPLAERLALVRSIADRAKGTSAVAQAIARLVKASQ